MSIEDHLRAGRVGEALQALQEQIRNRPEDPELRGKLFPVLAVLGQWERVLTQLQVLSGLDPGALLVSRLYEAVVQAEFLRREIFAGKAAPVIFGEPEPWLAQLRHGNELAAAGDFAAAHKCLQEALDAAPVTPGNVNGLPCQWLADGDLRFGPVLEAVIEGRYFWVPFFRIKELRIQPPKFLRDLIWLPVGFIWTNGGEAPGFVFVRYPGTESIGDGEFSLARKTGWQEQVPGLSFGCGQRVLVTEDRDVALLDIRSVNFVSSDSAVAANS